MLESSFAPGTDYASADLQEPLLGHRFVFADPKNASESDTAKKPSNAVWKDRISAVRTRCGSVSQSIQSAVTKSLNPPAPIPETLRLGRAIIECSGSVSENEALDASTLYPLTINEHFAQIGGSERGFEYIAVRADPSETQKKLTLVWRSRPKTKSYTCNMHDATTIGFADKKSAFSDAELATILWWLPVAMRGKFTVKAHFSNGTHVYQRMDVENFFDISPELPRPNGSMGQAIFASDDLPISQDGHLQV